MFDWVNLPSIFLMVTLATQFVTNGVLMIFFLLNLAKVCFLREKTLAIQRVYPG